MEDNDVNIVVENVAEVPLNVQRPYASINPFEVSLTSYSYQPWTNKHVDLTQWFNYGLNPSTWSKYCLKQIEIQNSLNTQKEQHK